MNRANRQSCSFLEGPSIEPLKLAGNESAADLIDHIFAKSGFNARRLAEGAQLYVEMLDADAVVALAVRPAQQHE